MRKKPVILLLITISILQSTLAQSKQEALEKLNFFLSTFSRVVNMNQFSMEKDSIFLLYKGEKYYRFHQKDVTGATIDEFAKTVDLYCTDKSKCFENLSNSKYESLKKYAYEDRIFFVKRTPNSGMNEPFNYAELANLLNKFLYAVKGKAVPETFLYDENKYAVSKSAEEEAYANARTPLEKAVARFVLYTKDLYLNKSYIKKVNYSSESNHGILTIDDERIGLDNIDGVMLYRNYTEGYSKVQLFTNTKKTDYWGNYTRESTFWSEISNLHVDSFFVLLGNIIEFYKEQTIKNYKTSLSYEQRLAYLKNNGHAIIPGKSTVKLVNAGKDEVAYSSLRKKKGETFRADGDLYLNPDLKSYSGRLEKENNTYKILNVELEFVSPPPALTEDEVKQRKKKEADSLFLVLYSKKHFDLITELSKKTLENDNKLMAKNGFSLVDESTIMAYTEFTSNNAYGQSYKPERLITYTFIVTGIGLKDIKVDYGGKKLNIPSLKDDPYLASLTMPLIPGEDGINQYILTFTATENSPKQIHFDAYAEFFHYAFIRRYRKK